MHKPINGAANAFRAVITGTGSHVPDKILTNGELAQMVDTSDEWITTRTGIKARHIASDTETTGTLASQAAKEAIKNAGIDPAELDLIIVGTVTPEMVFPSTACFVQMETGAKNAFAFDLAAACSGFVYSLSVAQQYIENSMAKNVLVIGTDTLTKITNWQDRASCILFGDGAGAVVLQQSTDPKRGIIYSTSGSDGNGWKSLNTQAYGSRYPINKPLDDPNKKYIQISGREIYQQAVRSIVESINKCLDHCDLKLDQIDMLISHQMNARIIESAAKRIKLPQEKVFVNIANYGNTSAASIPIALHECITTKKVKKGDIVVFVAFGAGTTWGANIVCI